MIPSRGKREAKSKRQWHYLAVKKIISIFKRINIKKNNGDFYCLNCHQTFSTKNKLESHKVVFENKFFVM